MTEKNASPVNYITEEILKDICHEVAAGLFAIEEPMGLYADHDEARLQASLALPRQSFSGEELYKGPYRKAAVLFYAINRNHAFGNGNKRLSVASLVVFLYINNIILKGSDAELRDKALWLAQVDERIERVIDHLAEWIEQNSLEKTEYERINGPLK